MIRSSMLLLLCLGFLTPAITQARQSPAPVVIYKSGEVRFTPDDGRAPYAVTSGDYLGLTGQLMLGPGATVEMNFASQYLQLTEAGDYQMAEVLKEKTDPSGLLGRFYDFISNGLDQSKSRQTLEKAYIKNQGNAQGNTRGLGDEGLVNVRPFGGKLTAANYGFTWPAYPSADHYEFSILEERTGNFIITALAADNKFSVNLGHLDLVDGQSYTWVCRAVTSGGEGGGSSLLSRGAPKTELASITFTYTDEPFLTHFEALGGELPAKEGSMLYHLGLAEALETNGYLTDADYLYASLVEANETSPLLKSMYASFLARWNLRSEANRLVGW